MTAYINKLKDKTGNQQLPVTHERAVRDDNGTTLESKMQNLEGAMDKAYVASSDNGMGRITLKKNMVSGVNTLTQSMMRATNTIYIIRYDFTLGEDITIPANCVLEFDGGSISGLYTITFNNTKLISPMFSICTFAGNVENDSIYLEDLGLSIGTAASDKNRNFAVMSWAFGLSGVSIKFKYSGNEYRVSDIIMESNVHDVKIYGNGNTIIYDNNIVDQNKVDRGVIDYHTCKNIYIENISISTTINYIAKPLDTTSQQYQDYVNLRTNSGLCRAGIQFYWCEDCVLNRCNAYHTLVGLGCWMSKNIKFEYCTTNETVGDGIVLSYNNCVAINCTVKKSNDDSFSMWGMSNNDDDCPHNCYFINCTSIDSMGVGVCIAKCFDCHAINMTVLNCARTPFHLGLMLDDSHYPSNRSENCSIENMYCELGEQLTIIGTEAVDYYLYEGELNKNILISDCTIINNITSQRYSRVVFRPHGGNFIFKNCSFKGIQIFVEYPESNFDGCAIDGDNQSAPLFLYANSSVAGESYMTNCSIDCKNNQGTDPVLYITNNTSNINIDGLRVKYSGNGSMDDNRYVWITGSRTGNVTINNLPFGLVRTFNDFGGELFTKTCVGIDGYWNKLGEGSLFSWRNWRVHELIIDSSIKKAINILTNEELPA